MNRKNALGIFFSISTLLLLYPIPLDLIWLIGRNPADGIGGTIGGNGTLVAVYTEIVPDLQVERSVPKGRTALYTFGTANAQILVDDVLKIRLLNELTLYGRRGAELILGTGLPLSPWL